MVIIETIHFSDAAIRTNMRGNGITKSMNVPAIQVITAPLVFVAVAPVSPQTAAPTEAWQPFTYFVGKWEGNGRGQLGVSTIERAYRRVWNDKFLHVENRCIYEPQPLSPGGETHEDWGMISIDSSRTPFIFRQFGVSDSLNQYVSTDVCCNGETIVFTADSIENIPAGWRARETYKILNGDEFVEIFELAEPGREFQINSAAKLRRKK
jgi:hypothetical protein